MRVQKAAPQGGERGSANNAWGPLQPNSRPRAKWSLQHHDPLEPRWKPLCPPHNPREDFANPSFPYLRPPASTEHLRNPTLTSWNPHGGLDAPTRMHKSRSHFRPSGWPGGYNPRGVCLWAAPFCTEAARAAFPPQVLCYRMGKGSYNCEDLMSFRKVVFSEMPLRLLVLVLKKEAY